MQRAEELRQRPPFDTEEYKLRMLKYFNGNEKAKEMFCDALAYASRLHEGQTRQSGVPFISHPCAVAEILAREMKIRNPYILVAALLHDTVEDTEETNIEDIEHRFGKTVAELVDGCTKLTQYQKDRATLKDLTHSKIFLSASRQLGVLIIKLADRLHNLRTLYYLPRVKRQRIAQETIEVYAPLAAKLNIFPIKRELYHLALIYLYPKKSKRILNALRSLINSPEIAEVETKLRESFKTAPFEVSVRSRIKGLGAYYDPLKKTLELTNAENRVDLIVVVKSNNELDCYTALGIVNSSFPPIPRSVRDFIANPKNNGYMSLHTRIRFRGEPYLVKIRTEEMDHVASYGLLTRWEGGQEVSEVHLQEVSEFLRTLGEYDGAGAKRKALLRFSEEKEVTVFTPKGEMQTFPKGSVVLDFAYKIHSDLGDHCQGALINGELVGPTHLLKDGDMVEVIVSKEPQDVDPELENLCKTPKARAAINRRLQRRRRQYAEEIGRQILLQELARYGYSEDLLVDEKTHLALEILNVKGLSELYIKIGQDLISPKAFLYYFHPPSKGPSNLSFTDNSSLEERNVLKVDNLDRAIHKFARCCKPYPGMKEVVATLSERGVTFHRSSCADLIQRHELPLQRLVDVVWENKGQWETPLVFKLEISAGSQQKLLSIIAGLPETIECREMELLSTPRDQRRLKMTVVLSSFKDAYKVFSIFPEGTVTVEGYYRDDSLKS